MRKVRTTMTGEKKQKKKHAAGSRKVKQDKKIHESYKLPRRHSLYSTPLKSYRSRSKSERDKALPQD